MEELTTHLEKLSFQFEKICKEMTHLSIQINEMSKKDSMISPLKRTRESFQVLKPIYSPKSKGEKAKTFDYLPLDVDDEDEPQIRSFRRSSGQESSLKRSSSTASRPAFSRKSETGKKRSTSFTAGDIPSPILPSGIFLEDENKVKLNIGGQIFVTTLSTLLKDRNSMFAAMFGGSFPLITDETGALFIDRDPTHFRYILNYLRDGVVSTTNDELLMEAQFYQIDSLVRSLVQKRRKLRDKTRNELTQEKQYKLVSVKNTEIEEVFEEMTISNAFDFEGWIKISEKKSHLLFSKSLSKGEIALLDRLLMG